MFSVWMLAICSGMNMVRNVESLTDFCHFLRGIEPNQENKKKNWKKTKKLTQKNGTPFSNDSLINHLPHHSLDFRGTFHFIRGPLQIFTVRVYDLRQMGVW